MSPASHVPTALVLQHDPDTPAGLLGDWLEARGIGVTTHHAYGDRPLPDPSTHAFVVSLGSEHSVNGRQPWVSAELALLRAAIVAGVPVLGLCFGAQSLAVALGGSVRPAGVVEIGWYEVDSSEPSLVPPGTWLEYHHEAFTIPPGAQAIASRCSGPQAFRSDPHLGVQFHPEVTEAIVAEWLAADRNLARLRVDRAAVLADGAAHAAGAARRAFALFDAWHAIWAER